MPGQELPPGADAPAREPGRLQDLLAYERRFWSRGVQGVAGIDEVGRGPLAGPVVAAAVVLPVGVSVPGATDSKRVADAEEREALAEAILSKARAVGVGAASVREIDRTNILVATTRAMSRALEQLCRRLRCEPEHVVVDGLPVRGLACRHEAVVGGDGAVHTIACASIVAKVCRDRLMTRLAVRYPGYGWDKNVGYGTAEHRAAIRRLGPTPHHRMTFGLMQLDLGLFDDIDEEGA
jgi:ribonuclease HII